MNCIKEKKLCKGLDGKWQFENYTNIPVKSSKQKIQIALMHSGLNSIGTFEKRVPKAGERVEESTTPLPIKDKTHLIAVNCDSNYEEIFEKMGFKAVPGHVPFGVIPIYQPEEKVKGKVYLKTNKSIELDKLQIQLFGSTDLVDTICLELTSFDLTKRQVCIDKSQDLWKKDNENFTCMNENAPAVNSDKYLMAGEYEWSFCFDLSSENLLPSVPHLTETKDYFFYIHYFVKASLSKGHFFGRGNVSTHHGIWVNNHFDVALDQDNLKQVIERKSQKTGLLNDGNIDIEVSLPKRGFVVGEIVPISIEIDNRSGESIQNLTAKIRLSGKYLSDKSKFRIEYPIRLESDPVVHGSIAAGESPVFNWNLKMSFSNSVIDEHLLPLSNLNHELLNIQYQVIVLAKRKATQKDVEIKIPIVIGSFNSADQKLFGYLHENNCQN